MLRLKNVRVHNLKSVNLDLEEGKLICFTGISGSGKSSLAFDTIYIEGQRRYVESLPQHARRFLEDLPKPDADSITGITPTISIEQKTSGRNPRSTVGTITEIYDYLRLLYSKVAIPHCPVSGESVSSRSKEEIIHEVEKKFDGKKLIILSPYARSKKGEFKDDFDAIERKGYTRVRVNGTIEHISDKITLDKNRPHDVDVVIDRLEVSSRTKSRLTESLTTALEEGNSSVIILDPDTLDETLYSTKAYSPKSGLSYEPLEPHDFSFNSPIGMCPECKGMGEKHEFILDKIIDPEKSINEDCCSVAGSYKTVRYGNIYDNLARIYDFDVACPFKDLSESAKKVFLYGTEKKWTRMYFVHPETGARWQDHVAWRGVLHEAYQRYQQAKSDGYRRKLEKLMHLGTCTSCQGSRIKPYPSSASFHGKFIHELTAMPIREALNFFKTLKLTNEESPIAAEITKEIYLRLKFLQDVGVDYLQLSRLGPTLSGGESQRVRLAAQIGSGLVGVTYILDEPSIGLHPVDNKKLIAALKNLRDKNNTVIVVEHDEETILSADHIVDVGPKAGVNGGLIIHSGDISSLLACKESLTSDYLTGRRSISIPKKRRTPKNESISISGLSQNNLKNIDLNIPLGCFIAVTGVSGSGKSSLFLETLYPAIKNKLLKTELPCGAFKELLGLEHIDKVIEIDQMPIGRTPRSNPATYVGIFDEIRKLFTELPESKSRGFKVGRFSFNVKEGSCRRCNGMGMLKIDMEFLEDEWVECPECHGMRFDEETLSIRYKGKNIYEVLEMDVKEAFDHFVNIPKIATKLELLKHVGLEYIKLGQSSTTISGGEAERIKLANELCHPATGNSLYILDEPTTGLHFYDIENLLKVLHALVDKGNTVIAIEHNMELVKTADYVIDMGPGSGEMGGEIVGMGSPEDIAKMDTPTGHALKEILYKKPIKVEKKTEKALPIKSPLLTVKGARQNNLKVETISFPHEKMTVVTGPSGSGKSSFAFETVFAEGQRRYVESLSPYIRQFIKQCPQPKIEEITGLQPTIAIEQRLQAGNPRSTVGTMTEVYDYLRILFSRVGIPHCPKTGYLIKPIGKEQIAEKIVSSLKGEKIHILSSLEIKSFENPSEVINRLKKEGYTRIRLNGKIYDISREEPPFDTKRKNEFLLVIDRLKVDASQKMRLLESVDRASSIGKGKLIIMKENGDDIFYNLSFSCVETGESFPEITPQTFAFNNPHGMCPECLGLGQIKGYDFSPFIQEKSIVSTLNFLWGDDENEGFYKLFSEFAKKRKINISTPFEDLTSDKQKELIHGDNSFVESKVDSKKFRFRFLGINKGAEEAIKHLTAYDSQFEEIDNMAKVSICSSCKGGRLNPLARAVTINEKNIIDLCNLSTDQLKSFIETLSKEKSLKLIYDELTMRLEFLKRVGLGYLSLSRSSATISAGEAERVMLARQIGSGLTRVLYVIDEPTIGLHPHDVEVLLKALEKIKELGNTLLVVEHDPQLIKKGDYIIEFGPGSGKDGGSVIQTGSPEEFIKNPNSLTGKVLTNSLFSDFKEIRKKPKKKGEFTVLDATVHNLKNFTVKIPTNELISVTGVSGAGKSTLLFNVIQPAIESKAFQITPEDYFSHLIVIDQKPMSQTHRSDVASYVDLLTPLRHFFAKLPEARAHGLEPKHFSPFHRKGMCSHCFGMGYKKIEMYFLPPVKIACPHCHGLKLNSLSLSIRYHEKNLGEILGMTVDEVQTLFQFEPKVMKALNMLSSLGLGYLNLGQEVASLSNGEAQRLKLAYQFSRRIQGKTLYLLDEPTTGLHTQEVEKLLKVLFTLVEKGHTVIAVEHNLDFISASDHIIDLGPGAGENGGKLVAQGTPQEIISCKNSLTGKFLKEHLS